MYGMGGLFGGGFMMLIWLVVIIGGVIVLVNWLKGQDNPPGRGETPLEILKKRYARGEISKEEYDRMKNELQ